MGNDYPLVEFTSSPGIRRLSFDVITKPKESLDVFAFIYLIVMKFDGRIDGIGRHRDRRGRYGAVDVLFPTHAQFDDARLHCITHLQGSVASSYLGALDAADPSRRMAKELRAAIRSLRIEALRAPFEF